MINFHRRSINLPAKGDHRATSDFARQNEGAMVNTEISQRTAALRGRIGFAILILSGIAMALFHVVDNADRHAVGDRFPVNLPLPTNQGILSKNEPVKLTAVLAQAAFHPSPSCNIASINGNNYNREFSVAQGKLIGLEGWLADRVNETVPQFAWIILTEKKSGLSYQTPITFRMSRQDVREALGGNRGYMRPGFISNIKADRIVPGEYHIYIKYRGGTDFYTCDNGRYLIIGSDDHE